LRAHIRHETQSLGGAAKKLSILTQIDVLADVWGPVWGETIDGSDKTAIRKYHVSKGAIYRVEDNGTCPIEGAVTCHWYNWIQNYGRRLSDWIGGKQLPPISTKDNLLIGSSLSENKDCYYTLDDFETAHSNELNSLGPTPSSWKLDSGTIGLQISAPKFLAIQIQGNVKRIPETTVKQHIWERWNFAPERANPVILREFFGIEVSHCTGNAWRITLGHLILSDYLALLVDRQIPHWNSIAWWGVFRKALLSDSNEMIIDFWKNHRDKRGEVGRLVCSVLEVLDSTGKADSVFRAAFINKDKELGFNIKLGGNEWASLLKDSYMMATYAIIGDHCLEYAHPGYSTCSRRLAHTHTALQTRIGLRKGSSVNERLRVEPHSLTFKLADQAGNGIHLMTPESGFRRVLTMGWDLAVGRELLDQFRELNSQRLSMVFRASTPSYGGMTKPRTAVLQKGQQQIETSTVSIPAETNQASIRQTEVTATAGAGLHLEEG
jgi:hypothetical protein